MHWSGRTQYSILLPFNTVYVCASLAFVSLSHVVRRNICNFVRVADLVLYLRTGHAQIPTMLNAIACQLVIAVHDNIVINAAVVLEVDST